jgi:hypothetical protein
MRHSPKLEAVEYRNSSEPVPRGFLSRSSQKVAPTVRWVGNRPRRAYPYGMGRPRDHQSAAQDMARELADIAAQLASLKGEAHAWLRSPDYDALKHRLENAHAVVEAAAVEARRRVRMNEGR